MAITNIFRILCFLLLCCCCWCFHSPAAGSYHSFQRSDTNPLHSMSGGLEDLRLFKNGIQDKSIGAYAEAEAPNENGSTLVTLLLAGNQTKRPDILRGFSKYKGGWNITNKHYWTSVGFTGSVGFILAILWFFLFGIVLVCCFFRGCKLTTKQVPVHQRGETKTIRLALLIIFTCVSVTGCIVLSVGQVRFHGGVMRTLNYVVNQSDYTVDTLRNVTEYLAIAKRINVSQVILSSDIGDVIDQLSMDLNTAARTLTEKTDENADKIKRVFSSVRSALIVVASVMLVLALLGLVLSLRGHQGAIHIFILSGWLLVAFTFLLCGVFVIFYSAIDDTCLAMQQWADNPRTETALSEILPCVDESTTNQTQLNSNKIVLGIITLINQFIYTYADTTRSPNDPYFYYNQSGPLLPPLCYPSFIDTSSNYCNPNQVSMTNASHVWTNYVCQVDRNDTCTTVGRLTPSMYDELTDAVDISYGIKQYTPPMLSLQNCNFVRDTFVKITSSYCPPLERDLKVVNAGLGLVSVGVMLCLVIWIWMDSSCKSPINNLKGASVCQGG